MLCNDDQILDINDTVTQRCWANITQRIVFAPVVHDYAHVGSVDYSVAVQVNDRKDWRLPYVIATDSAGPAGRKEEGRTIR
jgi:hypothetical protein